MLTKTAFAHFKDNQAAVARALGVSSAAISKWGEIVPFESATALEILTEGAITVDPQLYPRIASAMAEVARS